MKRKRRERPRIKRRRHYNYQEEEKFDPILTFFDFNNNAKKDENDSTSNSDHKN